MGDLMGVKIDDDHQYNNTIRAIDKRLGYFNATTEGEYFWEDMIVLKLDIRIDECCISFDNHLIANIIFIIATESNRKISDVQNIVLNYLHEHLTCTLNKDGDGHPFDSKLISEYFLDFAEEITDDGICHYYESIDDKELRKISIDTDGRAIVIDSFLDIGIMSLKENLSSLIKEYTEPGTDEQFTVEEKMATLNNTISLLNDAMQDMQSDIIPILESKLTPSPRHDYVKGEYVIVADRPRKAEALFKAITKSTCNYILRHKQTGEAIYPVIADMIAMTIEIEAKQLSNNELIVALLPSSNILKKNNTDGLIADELLRQVEFRNDIQKYSRIRPYIAFYFSEKFNIDITLIRPLARMLLTDNIKSNRCFAATPFKQLPSPPIDQPFKFSIFV